MVVGWELRCMCREQWDTQSHDKKSHRPGKCHCNGVVERGGEGRGRERRGGFESKGWEGKEGHRESRPRIMPK